jgi:hypothetical protein
MNNIDGSSKFQTLSMQRVNVDVQIPTLVTDLKVFGLMTPLYQTYQVTLLRLYNLLWELFYGMWLREAVRNHSRIIWNC